MKKLFGLLLVLAVMAFWANHAFSAEHPGEHPGTPAVSEEAEHPGEAAEHPGEEAALSANDIIKGIKDHINKVTEANDGVFPIYDAEEDEALALKLIKVHEERVSYIKKEDAYFACTDFIEVDDDDTYDIDFWMKKGEGDSLIVYDTKIHKKDGEPRFTYQDDEIVPVE